MTENSPTTPPPGPLPSTLPDSEHPLHMMADRLLAEETLERLRNLEVVVRRMDAELAEHRRRLSDRPAWTDEILAAVAAIETNRALQAKVDALEADVVELSQWRAGRECNAPGCPQRAARG